MAFYKDEKLAILIDGANMYAAARTLQIEIDFRKLLDEFKTKGRLLRATYYTVIVENEDYSPLRPLVDWLAYNGFTVKEKSAREHTDKDGRRRVRGNSDVELAVDMVMQAEHVDHILLFSGNGDFTAAVEAAKSKGVRVTVVSTMHSQPPMIADDLRRAADTFIELSDLTDRIGRPKKEHDDGR